MGSEESKQLIDLALKAYLEEYNDDKHDSSTFLDFAFVHLLRTHPRELNMTLRRIQALGAGSVIDAIFMATKDKVAQ